MVDPAVRLGWICYANESKAENHGTMGIVHIIFRHET